MTPQLALPAEVASPTHGTTEATHAQTKRFEAAMDRTSAEYIAPPAHGSDLMASQPWIRHASNASEKMRASIETPLEIPEGASDIERLTAVYTRTEATALAVVQLDYATKTTEIGTRNMQTIYQMQG